ncbi:MAG: hypothetical protein AAB614_02980 [Patescibacteria group bacterium]
MANNDLEKLEKKVLSRKWGESKQMPEYEVYKESDLSAKKLGWNEGGGKRIIGKSFKSFKMLWVLLLSLIFSGAIYFYYSSSPIFNQKSIKMYITGPSSVSSGEAVSYKVSYRNDSNVILNDVNLSFEWPAGSVFEGAEYFKPVKIEKKIGLLMPNQEKVLILDGRIYGEKDAVKHIKVDLKYIPAELGEPYILSEEFVTSIGTVPIFLNITIPKQVVADKESEMLIEYVNDSDASFSNMEIRAQYSSGFIFASSNPNPAKSNNLWQLGTILGNESGFVTIRGKFNGLEAENQLISFDIGQAEPNGDGFSSFASAIAETRLASSALLVFQTVNGSRDASANFGDTLTYKISYRNTTDTQISNVIMFVQLEDKLLDLKTLSIPWGSFDGRTNSIIWNQSGVPELSVLDPGEEGSVTFSVRVNQNFTPKSVLDKNLKIKSSAQIASGSLPENLSGLPVEDEDTLYVKLQTSLGFNATGYYDDGQIGNFGSLPPMVGSETSYAISWQVVNTINDVKDAVITASLPLNVKWTGLVYPKDADISYDKDKGVVTWKPGIIFAGSGFIVPSQRVDFQVSFLPAIAHVGQQFKLISESTFNGVDAFTNKEINRISSLIDSSLKGIIKSDNSRVIQ